MGLFKDLIEWWRRRRPPKPPPDPPPPPPPDPPSDNVAAELLRLHNAERLRAGVRPLRLDARLNAAAQGHAGYMAAVGKLDHWGIGNGDPWSRVKDVGYIGNSNENIAWNYVSPADVTGGWMGSKGHRENMLDPTWRDAGFGMTQGRDGRYWCAVFGSQTAKDVAGKAVVSLSRPLRKVIHGES